MSEYTTVYLRSKDKPLLEYKDYPSGEETHGLEDKDIHKLIKEVEEYNNIVHNSFGCRLFYIGTTPSRELDVLPYSPDPKPLTKNLLDDVLDVYKERINDYKESIVNSKEIIERLEKRIVKANLEIYDKIAKEINQHNESIVFLEEEIDNYQYYYNKFYFLNGILEGNSTFDNYELIYTKC